MPRPIAPGFKPAQRPLLAIALVAGTALLSHPAILSLAGLAPPAATGLAAIGLAVIGAVAGLIRPQARLIRETVAEAEAACDRFRLETTRGEEARRSADLALANTRAALERSQASSHAFLTSISHEIRTPLTGVIGVADLLTETALDDEQTALVDTVRQSAEALKSIVAGVVDYARLQAGDIRLEQAAFDIRDVAEKAMTQAADAARKKGLTLILDLPAGLATACTGDAGRVGQIIGHLLDNAIKFTNRGDVVMRLRGTDRRAQQDIVIEVEDTGVGIAEDSLRTVFDPFVRLDPDMAERYGGTGIGLTLVRELAQAMGGRIEVRSEAGRGSCFTLRLPIREARASRRAPRPPADLAGQRVLLLDANAASRDVLARRLSEWGATVIVALTGEAAQDQLWDSAAGQGGFDLVLADRAFGGSGAMSLAELLAERAGDIPFVLIGAPPVTQPDGAAAACVSRPVLTLPLADAIRRALSPDAARPARMGDAIRLELAPACIVLADDNATNRTLIAKFLADEPMTLIHAPDGIGAIEAFRDWAPDLILMDVSMPRLDGLEATRRIRAMETSDGAGGHVPIIALTASAMAGDRDACLEAGMDDYVAKPIRKAQLKAKITEFTARRHAPVAALPPPAMRNARSS